jgi:pyruvate/2-oxoglutarate dehydrogenase complex dihydrolipoamide acyltransferase (E2) component
MTKGTPLKGWRKIAAASWGPPKDPQIYGDVIVDAGALTEYLEELRSADHPVTLTHLVGKALAYAYAQNPDLNGHLARGRFVRHETVDVFFIVSAEKGAELSGVCVRRADEKSVVEIAQELRDRAARIRSGTDEEFGKSKSLLATLTPRPLSGLLRTAAWIAVDRGWELPQLGIRRYPFGSALVSSVGMFGIDRAYAPLSPYYKVPFLVLVGAVTQQPRVVDGQVVPRPVLEIHATLDHRYLDGFHAGRLARSAEEYLSDPARHEPATS